MFYPKNFPQALEQELINLLLYIQNNQTPLHSSKDLVKHTHTYLKEHPDTLFQGTVPSFWWMQFILIRHAEFFSKEFVNVVKPLLTKTKTRSLSGIVALSLFTKGVGCPFNCAYCPSEPGMPKSYLSDEPAVMRALRHSFDPYLQTQSRLLMFCLSNHPLDKVEIIIKGGTFSFYTHAYRTQFVKHIFAACNSDVKSGITNGIMESKRSSSLTEEQVKNESAKSRVIGINVETRPDYITPTELRLLRRLGVTHVEIGVQALDDTVYKRIRRGHTIKHVIEATQMLKDAGFKVGYHLMLNLPGVSAKQDLALLKKTFEENSFKPDHLKLYPTAITPYTDINTWFKSGTYEPYPLKEMIRIITKFKSMVVPFWTRIGRLTRDITTPKMEHNPFPPNLREIIQTEMNTHNFTCQCIRCREIRNNKVVGKIIFRSVSYQASEGIEYFLEYVDEKKHSLGFLRLRIPSYIFNTKTRPIFSILKNASIVRELHIYGQSTEIGSKTKKNIQHKKLGVSLLKKAEKITQKQGLQKIAVIAGVGTRNYYRKFGYHLIDTYMLKNLNPEG